MKQRKLRFRSCVRRATSARLPVPADLGIVKPDPATYLRTLEMLNVPAAETVFVDDRAANVTAAEACGMRGLVFKDTASFIADLEKVVGR